LIYCGDTQSPLSMVMMTVNARVAKRQKE